MKRVFLSMLVILIIVSHFDRNVFAMSPEELGQQRQAGSYRVRIYTHDNNGNPVEEYPMVTVTLPFTVISEVNQEGIDAGDIKLPENQEIASLSDGELIKQAGAHAWSLADGAPVLITGVKVSGEVPCNVTFSTEKGTAVTVKAFYGTAVFDQSESVYRYTSFDVGDHELYYKYLTRFLALLLVLPLLMLLVIYWMTSRKAAKLNRILYRP